MIQTAKKPWKKTKARVLLGNYREHAFQERPGYTCLIQVGKCSVYRIVAVKSCGGWSCFEWRSGRLLDYENRRNKTREAARITAESLLQDKYDLHGSDYIEKTIDESVSVYGQAN